MGPILSFEDWLLMRVSVRKLILGFILESDGFEIDSKSYFSSHCRFSDTYFQKWVIFNDWGPLVFKKRPFWGPVYRPPLTGGQFPGPLGALVGDNALGLPQRAAMPLLEPCGGLDH